MKKIILTLILLCANFIYCQIDSYGPWTRTNTSYPLHNLFTSYNGDYFMFYNNDLYRSNGLFYSWEKIESGHFADSPSILFYAGNNVYLVGTANGIYRETNLSNWSKITSGLPDTIAISGFVKNVPGSIFASTSKGIYCSTDNGSTWSARNNGVPPQTDCINLQIDENNILYFTSGYTNISVNRGLYRSTNAGVSWQKAEGMPSYETYSLIYINSVGNVFASGASYAGGIPTYGLYKSNNGLDSFRFVCSQNPHSIINTQFNSYIGTFNYITISGTSNYIAVSSDGGATWNTTLQNSSGINYNNLYSLQGSFIATSGYPGLWKTTNLGQNWSREIKGIPIGSKVSKLEINVPNIYAIANGQLYNSTTRGDSWNFIQLPVTLPSTVSDLTLSGSNLYILLNSNIYKSTNSGTNFTQLGSPTPSVTGVKISNGVIYVYGGGVYRTTNEGTNWETLINGYPAGAHINTLEVISGTIYLGTDNHGVYKSTNNGSSWVEANNGLTGSNILSIGLGNGIYAGTSGSGVFYSTNEGNNWVKVNSGIASDNLNYYDIIKNEGVLHSPYEVIFATGKYPGNNNYRGILIFNGSLISPEWSSLNTTQYVKDTSAYSLAWGGFSCFYGGDSGVYVQGWGDDIRSISSEIPKNFSLSQNYPNPFNPSTKFTYELNQKTFAKISVFDITGREIATLINGIQNAGVYEASFDAGKYGLTSGIYFYTLNAGEFNETRKMVLVK
ncbi:MAG: T9SS type A sorting domain-containing protein [Bacteroidetes bacterium]|nr:T9SS type A sorting domain-containing protein [Bacteroidota bacterium]